MCLPAPTWWFVSCPSNLAVPVMLTKADADHDLLKAFHSFLYGVVGKKTVRKKNIRRYC